MKLNFSKTFTISLIATALLLSGCVDGEKDLYDPDFRAKNPMGDIVAPEGSDWQLSTTVELTVKVADEYNGQHYYIIDVFDANPAISADAHLLDKGVAKSDQPFATKLSVSKAIQTLYIRKPPPPDWLLSVLAKQQTETLIVISEPPPHPLQEVRL